MYFLFQPTRIDKSFRPFCRYTAETYLEINEVSYVLRYIVRMFSSIDHTNTFS